MPFKIVSENKPKGDQPQAIKEIVSQFENKDPYVTLQGVTGSGKTEVYMDAIAEAISKGTQVLVLFPEINLPENTSSINVSAYEENHKPKDEGIATCR